MVCELRHEPIFPELGRGVQLANDPRYTPGSHMFDTSVHSCQSRAVVALLFCPLDSTSALYQYSTVLKQKT